MSNFELQPWEIPFDGCDSEVVNARSTHLLHGVKVRCQMHVTPLDPQMSKKARGRKIPLFSLPQGWPEASFVECDEDPTEPNYTRYSYATNPRGMVKDFVTAWESNKIARLFWLNKQGTLRQKGEIACESLLVAASGTATWRHYWRGRAPGMPSPFSWTSPLNSSDLAQLSAAQIWQRVQQSLEDEASEAQFARDFARLDYPAKRAMVFKQMYGTEDEIKAVLHDILLMHEVCERAQSDELHLILRFGDKVGITLEDFSAEEEVNMPPALRRDVERLYQCITSRLKHSQCLRYWMRHEQIEVTARRPTAHERLEAHLRWREWQVEHL